MTDYKKVVSILRTLPQLKANVEVAKMQVFIIEKALNTLTAEEAPIAYKLFVNGEDIDNLVNLVKEIIGGD